MRWGFGKHSATNRDPAVLETQPPVRPAVADWRRVPPLGLTVARQPVLVGAALLGTPDVPGTRPILGRSVKDRERARSRQSGADAATPSGRVVGLVVPNAPPEAALGEADNPNASRGGPASELPPRAHWRPTARTAAAKQHPVLVKAVDDFVGTPQLADTPYTSSAWLRMIQGYRRLATDQDTGASDSLPGLTQATKPDGGSVATWSSTVAFAPPRAEQSRAPRPAAESERPRKLSLAESRRLGIGPPLHRGSGTADDEGGPDQVGSAEIPDEPAGRGGYEDGPDSATEPARGEEHGAADPAEVATGLLAARRAAGVERTPVPDRDSPPDHGRPDTRLEHAAAGKPAGPDADQRREPPRQPPAQSPQSSRSALSPPSTRARRPRTPVSPLVRPPGQPLPLGPADGAPEAHPHDQRRAAAAATGQGGPGRFESRRDAGQQATAGPVTPVVVAPVYRAATTASPSPATRRPASAPAAEPLVHRSPAAQPTVTQAAPAVAAPSAPEAPVPPVPPPPAAPEPPVVPAAPPVPGGALPWQSEDSAAPFAFPGLPPFAFPPGAAGRSAWPAQTPGWAVGGMQPPGAAGPAAPSDQPPGQAEEAAVPYDLADMLRRLHGIDVSDVAVDRSSDAGREARAAGARAFTRDQQVGLPSDEGPFERPQTRALLAHELTHVAQQRALGPSLPAEDSAHGAALEAEAAAVEWRVLGHDTSATVIPLQRLRHAAPLLPAAAFSSAADATTAPVQRQVETLTGIAGNAFDPFALLPHQGPAPAPPAESGSTAQQPAAGAAAGSEAAEEAAKESGKRVLDLDDYKAVSQFTNDIYRQVHARLRHELLVGRERSGLLSDFR